MKSHAIRAFLCNLLMIGSVIWAAKEYGIQLVLVAALFTIGLLGQRRLTAKPSPAAFDPQRFNELRDALRLYFETAPKAPATEHVLRTLDKLGYPEIESIPG